MPMPKNKDDLAQTKIHVKNINVDIEAISQGQQQGLQFVYNFACRNLKLANHTIIHVLYYETMWIGDFSSLCFHFFFISNK